MDWTQTILSVAWGDPTTKFFTIVIGGILVLSLLSLRIPSPRLQHIEAAAPTLMTTLGVLGTFTGVFLALLEFDVSNIDKSVPALLAGLKVAFATSIVGMTSAVLLKGVQTIVPPIIDQEAEDTPIAIHSVLKSMDATLKSSAERDGQILSQIKSAIAADGDGSLLTQIQKLRTTVLDGNTALVSEFREFAKNMADNNSKALIEALEKVIRDFNTQLNEQFGDNFKQLNAAVKDLVVWQQNYKDHVDDIERRYKDAVSALESSASILERVATHTAAIPTALDQMKQIFTAFETSIAELKAHLDAVANLRERAVEAFPIIENNIQTLTSSLSETVGQYIKDADVSRQKSQAASDALIKAFSEIEEKTARIQETFTTQVSSVMEAVRKEIQKTMIENSAAIDSTSTEMRRQINDAWSKTQDGLNEQFQIFDKQMQTELNRAIENLGRSLGALSEKFVSDYAPLTEKLRRLVQLSNEAA